ncbi:MAG: hypothetical protein L0H53_02805 [Candidatus Nitrosocosmicus sp.]|nr:hypothetical protein [Candidatus Nitrosocosmicus sp.]
MNKHLNSEGSSSKIFDDLVSQVIDAIDNDEFEPVVWVEKDIVMKCGCNGELEFFSEYVPRVLEKVSAERRTDLEAIRDRLKDKIRIRGGLSYGE